MNTAGLLAVLVSAKLIVLSGRGVALSTPGLFAYFWEDVAVACAIGLAARILAGSRQRVFSPGVRFLAGRVLYVAVVGYVAINVPVMLVLATPLTAAMLHGARGAIADSILYYLRPANLGSIALVIGVGILGTLRPRGSLFGFRRATPDVVFVAVFIGIGVWMAPRVETAGFERNALTALIPNGLPAVAASGGDEVDWRASDAPSADRDLDLSGLRGAARGFNVLTIVLESTAARYLQPYGAAVDPMPHLTAWAQHALLFENAYAVYPESIKGLFSVLCSRYPAFGSSAESHASARCESGPRLIKNAGYRTAMFHSGRFRYLGMQELLADKGFDVLEDAGAIGGHEQSSFGVDESSTVTRLLRWIDSLPPGARFMAEYLPVAGHHPYATSTPGPFPSNTEASQYRNALHDGDAHSACCWRDCMPGIWIVRRS
jgi:Sulfatase